MLCALVFDMDGLLIDSEPLWHEAEVHGFGLAGLCLTPEQCLETTGLRVDEVVRFRYAQHPWTAPSQDAVASAIVARVVELVHAKGVLKPGVAQALRFARDSGLRVALASSSPSVIIHAVLDTFGLRAAFEVIHSAEEEARGKPEPDVYLTAARKLGVEPAACVALEDSPNGVLAAKAAGMKCIAIPEPVLRHDPRLARADVLIESLTEVDADLLNRL
ncbi:MAG TPA: hexitol phosphatase HxpB [Thermoanaerobaculia bacterium]|nr:hexitol phosphatase HxpB [Thermoanaerobaculia bacterium]